eukprot:scaffold40039_cov25-Tisochrysis_lutea.AAC.3
MQDSHRVAAHTSIGPRRQPQAFSAKVVCKSRQPARAAVHKSRLSARAGRLHSRQLRQQTTLTPAALPSLLHALHALENEVTHEWRASDNVVSEM